MLMGNWTPRHWYQRAPVYAKAIVCLLVGRMQSGYPHHHELGREAPNAADSLATWDHRSWSGPEFQHYSWSEVAVCLGWRYWHTHVYNSDCP